MSEIVCPVCAQPFIPKRYASGSLTKTCSRTCAARYFRDKGENVPCARCGKLFYRRRSQAMQGFGTTCSHACHFALRRNHIPCKCKQCGVDFEAEHHLVTARSGGKFCSRRCFSIFRRKLRKRSEQEMFTQWQKREWKDEKCARCETTEKLELDHIIPRFAGGKAERSNAQTLCRLCNRRKFWTDDFPLWEQLLKLRAEES